MHTRFVHQYDEEMSKLKKERRPGRPASTREDILRVKIAADEKEYRDGFCWCHCLLYWLSANNHQISLTSPMPTMWFIWTDGTVRGHICLL